MGHPFIFGAPGVAANAVGCAQTVEIFQVFKRIWRAIAGNKAGRRADDPLVLHDSAGHDIGVGKLFGIADGGVKLFGFKVDMPVGQLERDLDVRVKL